ncbi:MAG: dTDP-glucose 4,6-dehydratase [Deltaproteobacteria bacterium]|nr:dTDP-glucose 4,6-dehydratase [Deltaproteobacteria bacterium]
MKKVRIVITGGSGFIGSHFIKLLMRSERNNEIFNIDLLTYAGDNRRLQEIERSNLYHFIRCDIREKDKILSVLRDIKPDVIFHFASETHVDNSIARPSDFITTNINGTFNILEFVRSSETKLIHISTDEIYGDRKKGESLFVEDNNYNPSSPYSGSKAAQEMLIKSYIRTYKIKSIIIRPCNNFGPFQHREKFIPKSIISALNNKPIEIYGDGKNKREWIYIDDGCDAIYRIYKKGRIGEIYNIGSGFIVSNNRIAIEILKLTGRPRDLILYVEDRPGHDTMYGVDFSKLRSMGFRPKTSLITGLKLTVEWYQNNSDW